MLFAHVGHEGTRLHQRIPFPLDILGAKYEYQVMKALGWLNDTDWLYRFRPTRLFVDWLANRVVLPIIHGEVVTPTEVEEMLRLVEEEGHPVSIGVCECRHGQNNYTDETEDGRDPNYTCVMIGDWGKGHLYSYPQHYKPIGASELAELTRFWHRRGRVLNAWGIGTRHGFLISYCHCKPEYCVPLRNQLTRGNQVFKPGYYFAEIDAEKCLGPEGCEWDCSGRCWFGAISVEGGKARADASLCQGCGQCFEYCPSGAARAVRKQGYELNYCCDDLLHPEARV
jgi:ferredoxin